MTKQQPVIVRNALKDEYDLIGALMVEVYSQLKGFPKKTTQPDYYNALENIGEITTKPDTEIIVASTREGNILGAVVNFSNMLYYGSGGTAPLEQNSSGFRFLAVHPNARGNGIGKRLVLECIQRAKNRNLRQVIIHTTLTMTTAWKMYETLDFKRSSDLDFMQGTMPVFGFRLAL